MLLKMENIAPNIWLPRIQFVYSRVNKNGKKPKIKVMLVDFSSLVEKNSIFRDNVIKTNTAELAKMLGVNISDAQTLQVQACLATQK